MTTETTKALAELVERVRNELPKVGEPWNVHCSLHAHDLSALFRLAESALAAASEPAPAAPPVGSIKPDNAHPQPSAAPAVVGKTSSCFSAWKEAYGPIEPMTPKFLVGFTEGWNRAFAQSTLNEQIARIGERFFSGDISDDERAAALAFARAAIAQATGSKAP